MYRRVYFVHHYFGNLIANLDNSQEYKSIQAPNLILSGKYDFACPHFLWKGIAEDIPNAKFVLFENSGHNPMIEIPEEFTKEVFDWVESLNILSMI